MDHPKSNYATFYLNLQQDCLFQAVTEANTKSYHSEKSLKAVNNTTPACYWVLTIADMPKLPNDLEVILLT